MSTTLQIKIRRIVNTDEMNLEHLNQSFDEGTVWNEVEGKKFLNDQNNALFIAFSDATMIGFASAHRLQRFDKRKAEVLLYEIGVTEQFQRQGVGKALVEAVKNWARSAGADEVWVLTNRSNTGAVALYQACGGNEDAEDTTMFTIATP